MTKLKPNKRIFIGIGTVIMLLVAGFYWISRQIPNWGSTAEEVNLTLPGDELIPTPRPDLESRYHHPRPPGADLPMADSDGRLSCGVFTRLLSSKTCFV